MYMCLHHMFLLAASACRLLPASIYLYISRVLAPRMAMCGFTGMPLHDALTLASAVAEKRRVRSSSHLCSRSLRHSSQTASINCGLDSVPSQVLMWLRVLIHGVTSLTLPLFSDDAKCLHKNMHCAYSVLGDVCACACTEQADANLRHTFVRFDKAQESL
jgi:hypothetical protein